MNPVIVVIVIQLGFFGLVIGHGVWVDYIRPLL